MAGMWRKTLVYLGLAEEDDSEEYTYEDFERVDEAPRKVATKERTAVVKQMPAPAPSQSAKFHLLHPSAFNDAQELGDKFREGYSVLMNLQGTDRELARRLVDFASGLAYGLAGSMQPVAESVFLLTPAGVQVSAEERRRLLEERGFFNQA